MILHQRLLANPTLLHTFLESKFAKKPPVKKDVPTDTPMSSSRKGIKRPKHNSQISQEVQSPKHVKVEAVKARDRKILKRKKSANELSLSKNSDLKSKITLHIYIHLHIFICMCAINF